MSTRDGGGNGPGTWPMVTPGYTAGVITALAAVLAMSTVQPPAHANAPIAVLWETFGLGKTGGENELSANAPASTLIDAVLHAGGLLGAEKQTATPASHGWAATAGKLSPARGTDLQTTSDSDLPAGWRTLDATKKETAGAMLTIDLNALRANADTLFDAPWMQRAIQRLALDNARLVSLRGTIHPPAADGLPPLLELKACASARSNPPGPVKPITLIAPGWIGTSTDAAAVKDANWAASVRFDSGGLGLLGRDGGVGTLAGVVRLCVDLVGTAHNADTLRWSKDYDAWQDRSSDALRSISTRMQQRGTLACYGTAAAPELVLIIPSRKGERADAITKAVRQLAAAGGMTEKTGVWTLDATGPTVPSLALAVCDTASGPWLLLTVERNAEHTLLKQAEVRMRQAR